MKIDSLTKEQQARFPEFVDRYRQPGEPLGDELADELPDECQYHHRRLASAAAKAARLEREV